MMTIDEGMELGVELGWWPSFDERGPHPFPFIVDMSKGTIRFTTTVNMGPEWKVESIFENGNKVWLRETKAVFMSQLLDECLIFKSIGDARKAGWNKKIEQGDFWFRSKTRRIIINAS